MSKYTTEESFLKSFSLYIMTLILPKMISRTSCHKNNFQQVELFHYMPFKEAATRGTL